MGVRPPFALVDRFRSVFVGEGVGDEWVEDVEVEGGKDVCGCDSTRRYRVSYTSEGYSPWHCTPWWKGHLHHRHPWKLCPSLP